MEVGLRNYTARQLEEGMTVTNRIVGDSSKLLEGRASRVYLRGRFPRRSFVVLVLLLATLSLGTACERTKAALAIPNDCQIKDASLSQRSVTMKRIYITLALLLSSLIILAGCCGKMRYPNYNTL